MLEVCVGGHKFIPAAETVLQDAGGGVQVGSIHVGQERWYGGVSFLSVLDEKGRCMNLRERPAPGAGNSGTDCLTLYGF